MGHARLLARSRGLAVAWAALALAVAGCDAPHSIAIAGQPADARVFEGQAAIFEVGAEIPDGVRYQWSRDGQPIPGATGARHVTAPTVPADDGATFTVLVTRGGAEATSRGARLTVDPPLDLRFKWAGAPYQPAWSANGSVFASAGGGEERVYGGVGTPLGPTGCSPSSGTGSWAFWTSAATAGMTTAYEAGLVDSLAPGWAAALGGDAVVTALDLEAPCGLYGLSVSRTTQVGAFEPAVDGTVAAAGLQAVATSEGAAGRVLTAVSHRDGVVSYVSHGWSLAPSAVYEARVVATPFDGLAGAAWDLAADGFIITAAGMGDRGASGFILVGTRPPGPPRPRSLLLGGPVMSLYRSHAIVAILVDLAGSRALVIGEE